MIILFDNNLAVKQDVEHQFSIRQEAKPNFSFDISVDFIVATGSFADNLAITDPQSRASCRTWRCFWFYVAQRDAVCLVRGFLAQHHGRVLKLLINRRPFFRAAKQQPAEILAKCDLCYTAPCENGGFCEALPGRQFRCKCTPGYHGDRCQHKIDACYGNPCRNSGTCKVLEEGRFRYLLEATVRLWSE